jgi:transposase
MMQSVPYLAQKMPIDAIAGLFGVSETTVKRWADHPDVKRALGDVSEHVVESTKATAEGLVEKAFTALNQLVGDEDVDQRVKLDAAKTILDRFGYPVASKQQTEDITPPRSREEALARLDALRAKLERGR